MKTKKTKFVEPVGPFVVCWKRSRGSPFIERTLERPMVYAADRAALDVEIDRIVMGCIMRQVTYALGQSSTIASSVTAGIGGVATVDGAKDVRSTVIIAIGPMLRVMTPNPATGVLDDAWKLMARAPVERTKWEKIQTPLAAATYACTTIGASTSDIINNLCRKPNTLAHLLAASVARILQNHDKF
jgi:hypothetical protein